MKYERKFVLKVSHNEFELLNCYVKDIHRNTIGYFFSITYNVENAKIWRYKKTSENSIEILNKKLDPTKPSLKKYTFESIEITDNQTLRNIKLNKIKKNEKK